MGVTFARTERSVQPRIEQPDESPWNVPYRIEELPGRNPEHNLVCSCAIPATGDERCDVVHRWRDDRMLVYLVPHCWKCSTCGGWLPNYKRTGVVDAPRRSAMIDVPVKVGA